MHGSLAEPTVVDYNDAQDKPEEFKKKDAIPEMTSTDSDGENHSTESTDPECALLPEANHARIAEVRVGVGNPEPHWQFDSSDNETQVPDKDSAAEAPAEALLQTHLLHAQNEKRQTYQQRTKHRPNGNLGFWAFVGDTLDNSAALPASPPSLHSAQCCTACFATLDNSAALTPSRPATGWYQNIETRRLKHPPSVQASPLPPPSLPPSDRGYEGTELEPFEWQARGFYHGHRSAIRPASWWTTDQINALHPDGLQEEIRPQMRLSS